MLQDKRVDLDAEKQKKLILGMVQELTRESPDLYYQPTSVIARQIRDNISSSKALALDDRELLRKLSQRDIEVMLSLH